jgi:hypothetical protein
MIKNISLKELYLTYPVESLFHTLTKDLVIKIDEKKYPNKIFYFNNIGNCIFEYDTKNGYFWSDYYNYCIKFYKKFDFNWKQVTDLTKDMVENHFNLNEIISSSTMLYRSNTVEKHFKFNGITPSSFFGKFIKDAENYFKFKIIK